MSIDLENARILQKKKLEELCINEFGLTYDEISIRMKKITDEAHCVFRNTLYNEWGEKRLKQEGYD